MQIKTVGIGESHKEVQLSTDRFTEEGCKMITIIQVTLGKEFLEDCKIIEAKISEVDIR